MSHRLAYPPNLPVPIATKIEQPGGGRVTALRIGAQAPEFDAVTGLPALTEESDEKIALATDAAFEALAVDQTPLDPPAGELSDDFLWARASFDDPLGRRIQLIGRQALIPPVAGQCFGGVATQMAQPCRPDVSDASSTGPRWILFPLIAWAEFEIRVNEEPTDTGVVGAIRLVQDEANALRLTLYPRVVDVDGQSRASPIQAAEDLGVAGWCIEWKNVDYLQVPVVTVRAERGDTLLKIAREMSVDADALIRANSELASPDEPLGGELINVPFIVRAATAVAKRVRATALTWREIVRGWTTLN